MEKKTMPYKSREDINRHARKWQGKRRDEFRETIKAEKAKRGNKCQICGYNACPEALLFHHRDKKDKKFKINNKVATRSNEEILKEINKCDLICSNCHVQIHKDEWFTGWNQHSKKK